MLALIMQCGSIESLILMGGFFIVLIAQSQEMQEVFPGALFFLEMAT
jgi:hypothetical protein